jgi:hypothetical protein
MNGSRIRLALVLLIVGAASSAAVIGCSSTGEVVQPPPPPPPPPPPGPPPPPPPPPGPAVIYTVVVSPQYKSAPKGTTTQLTTVIRDSSNNILTGRQVTWSSSEPSVATVNQSGVVTSQGSGVAIITATAEGQSGVGAVSVPMPSGSGAIDHVVIVIEENAEFPNIIGNRVMPYMNALASEYGLATQFYGNTHPSIGNYLMMTTGAITTQNNDYTGVVDTDNVVRKLIAAGRSWRSYAEGMPVVGYLGATANNNYVKKHNPFAFFTDVANDSVQRRNLVPFTRFHQDMNGPGLPAYSFVVPNLCSDGHDCTLSVEDQWLHDNIGPLLRNPRFQQSGLLIISFDEGVTNTFGGGRIVTIVVGPRAKRGFQSATRYQHQSLLRFSMEVLGLSSYPNAGAGAPSMMEFLTP